ncbi:MAG: tetratricopeptide repeat protein [Geminicoccaceae bacterium]
MIDFSDRIVTIVGRLALASSADVEAAVKARGGQVRRGQPRHAGVLVVSRLAFRQLDKGGFRRKLRSADESGSTCLSETMFLGELGLIEPASQSAGVVDLTDLPAKTGLALDTLRLLMLFDVIQPVQGQCSFRDLVAAKEVARLLSEGASLGTIIEGAAVAAGQRHAGSLDQRSQDQDQPLARLKLVSDEYGKIVNQIGSTTADLDGQLHLPLPDADNPSIDELFEAAEEAEWLGEFSVATKLYQRCIRLDRQDPIAPFNLANVQREQGDHDGAIFHLRIALGLDQHFPDAWYNLALLMDGRGEKAAAMEGFERAINADPNYADPVYNLAQLHFDAGHFDQAGQLWQRYLVLDPDSEWSRRARYGVAICRRQLPPSLGSPVA